MALAMTSVPERPFSLGASLPAETPYPPSSHIRLPHLDPPVRRDDLDGDNFPITWADDDSIYAAYGDGWGCRPMVPATKLNTGMVRITGDPPGFRGEEVRIPWYGGGAHRPNMKGCGLLSAGGTLYHFVRYQVDGATPSEPRRQVAASLIWSHDHGATWQGDTAYSPNSHIPDIPLFFHEPDHAFNSPTFLQAGRDYAQAQDEYVYLYSPREDLRRRNDHLDLARVPINHIAERGAYEFFAGSPTAPRWTSDITRRTPVFAFPGHVGAGDVVYWPALGRYLLLQCISWEPHQVSGPAPSRLALLDGPHPWGPWSTAGYVTHWGSGENGDLRYDPRLPAKWLAPDGTSAILIFSDRTQSDVLNYQQIHFEVLAS
jgi:hypothetical protein